jgi:hypothetical protein
MLFGKENANKKYTGQYIIGYDLSDDYAQLSYIKLGDSEPQTLSLVAGAEQYNIPLVMSKREEGNFWYIGKEALAHSEEKGGVLIEKLLTLACGGENVELGGTSYDPCALLALFIKRSLSLLSMVTGLDNVAAIMITVEELDERKVEVLQQVIEYLQLPRIQIRFMGREESIYAYNLHSDPALWTNPVLVYELEKDRLVSYRLYVNKNTTPLVTLVESSVRQKGTGQMTDAARDQWFLESLQEDMEDQIISTVYLIGEGFAGDWYQQSIRYLCMKRRVFRGNNLYSKGACYSMLDRLEPGQLSEAYVYLGKDKLNANVGMKLLRQGKEAYMAVLDGGRSWYECKRSLDVVLEKANALSFIITPLNGRNVEQTQVLLHGLNKEKQPLCRLHVEVSMEAQTIMKIRVWDKGFGEIYPSSGQYWEENLTL